MFTESFLPNLGLFIAGQAVAWYYLRTGRWWVGGLLMAVLWGAADWALVGRYVFADKGSHFTYALLAMQATAVWSLLLFGFAWWRRRWSGTTKRRPELFRDAVQTYLRGEHAAAAQAFRRLVRCNPWDAAAWLGLGNARWRLGRARSARAAWRRCRRVDLSGEYADLVGAMVTRRTGE